MQDELEELRTVTGVLEMDDADSRAHVFAERYTANDASNQAPGQLDIIRARESLDFVRNACWDMRGGPYMLATLTAHLRLAIRYGGLGYFAGRRTIAEMTKISSASASRCNDKLMKLGILELVKRYPRRERHADEWKIHLEKIACAVSLHYGYYNVDVLRFQSHDLWRYQGLGKSAAQVFVFLLQATTAGVGTSIAQIAHSTGRHRDTVKRVLAKMTRLEMAREDLETKTWTVCPGVDWDFLDECAKTYGVYGYSQKQHEKHIQERLSFE